MNSTSKTLDSLYDLAGVIENTALRNICLEIISDKRFQTWPGCKIDPKETKHHGYRGGLLVHTEEVTTQAVRFASGTKADRDVLITAGILHDFGKIWDYNNDGVARSHRYKIRHVARSYSEFMILIEHNMDGLEQDDDLVEAVGHCILSHHGRLEWGSPIEPQTEEAFILHSADMWSYQFGPNKLGPPED